MEEQELEISNLSADAMYLQRKTIQLRGEIQCVNYSPPIDSRYALTIWRELLTALRWSCKEQDNPEPSGAFS
jgi:hypothetical protein